MFIADLAEGLLSACSSDNAHRGTRTGTGTITTVNAKAGHSTQT
jgi:hypothetical protein